MKKALVMLLALAMLLPMALAMPANAEVEKEPFYTLGWSDFDNEKYPYLEGLLTSSFTNIGENAILSYGGAKMQYGSYTDADVTKLAETIKAAMDKRPEGLRYWHASRPGVIMDLVADDALFMDFGVDMMAEMMDAVLKKYKEIGGKLDGMVVDIEYVGLSTYYLIDAQTEHQKNNFTKNPKLLKQIVANPLYATEIRPLLEEYGFIFYDAGDPAKQAEYTELYSLTKNAGSKYAKSRLVWDTVMRIHLNRYVDEWLYTPLHKYFPEASLSDYQSIDSAAWLKMAAVTDDDVVMSGGNSVKSGNTSSFSYYYGRPSASFYANNQKYAGYNDAIFAAEPFSNLLYDINFTRHMYESTDTKQIAPWITYYTYGGKEPQSAAYTPYYTELLYHLGMFDPEPFLSYTYVGDKCFSEGRENSTHYQEVQQVKNEIMAELTRVAGYSDREPISMPLNWNSDFVLSGMYANGRNIWRITPNTNVVPLENFQLVMEGLEDPTFIAGGQTVSFPGGKIIEDSTISQVGSCGFWVETAKDVTPIVSSIRNRYEKYPSLEFDFEEYTAGAFDYNTSLPKKAWGFTWKKYGDIKGESTIVDVNGDKKLSIIGNSKNWITGLPTNITAGDTFAEDQAWQITVTIPEGMNADAQINLLTYTGTNQDFDDGSFMIKNGKLYYATGEVDEEEELVYAEMMDIAPGTYIFKRLMNFNHATPYSTFIVMNASGKELKKVENIPAPAFDAISTIGFGVAEAAKGVVVDDFKIYLTGTALDFSIYDAKTGQDAKLGETRDSSTAYRLSWLNATSKNETATLKADITSGGKTVTKIIKEINMIPGTDGIETGVVEIKEGETIKVYLDTSVKAPVEPSKPGETEPTQPQQTEPTQATPDTPDTPDVPTTATKAPTTATKAPVTGTRPIGIKITKATEAPEEPEPTEKPTQAPEEPEPTEEPTEDRVAPTEGTLAPPEEPEPTEETQAPTEETQAPTEPEETKGTEATTSDKDDKDKDDDKGGNTGLIIAIVAVVVLAGAGAAVYFLVIKKKKANA